MKRSLEGENSTEMTKKRKLSKKKKKSKKQKLKSCSSPTNEASGSSMQGISMKEEKMLTDSDDESPELFIDLEELFSSEGARPNGSHLYNSDITNLLLYTVLGTGSWDRPQWVNMNTWNNVKHTLFVMVESISGEDYVTYKECFKNINEHFSQGYPVQNAGSSGVSYPPLSTFLNYKMKKKSAKRKTKASQSITPAQVVLTKEERIVNEYPIKESLSENDLQGYVSTKSDNMTAESTEDDTAARDGRMFAIDCEMCVTANGKELTRISIVNESLEVVYDSFVKPDASITDYLTQFSGITAEILSNVKTTLGEVQQKVLEMVSADDIMVGHSLDNDLRCLKIIHEKVIDTAVVYGDKRGATYKPSLRRLVKDHLMREIQTSDSGHCPTEDARACMELVLLKLEKGTHYGVFDKLNESIFEAFSRANKTSAVVDIALTARLHCFSRTHGVLCNSDKEVVQRTTSYISKTDFVFSNLKDFGNLLKGCDKSGTKPEHGKVKATLKEIDDNLGEILENVPKDSLVVVLLSSGFMPAAIQALQKDKEQRKTDEVMYAAKRARDCLCFIKVTK